MIEFRGERVFGMDKAYHFVAGFTISGLAALFTDIWILIIFPSFFIGLGKEVFWDYLYKKREMSFMDFVWTVGGGLTSFIVKLIV